MKQIDIQGGYPIVVFTPSLEQRTALAEVGAGWCADWANADWCLAPDPFGELEFTFALESDRESFRALVLAAGEAKPS